MTGQWKGWNLAVFLHDRYGGTVVLYNEPTRTKTWFYIGEVYNADGHGLVFKGSLWDGGTWVPQTITGKHLGYLDLKNSVVQGYGSLDGVLVWVETLPYRQWKRGITSQRLRGIHLRTGTATIFNTNVNTGKLASLLCSVTNSVLPDGYKLIHNNILVEERPGRTYVYYKCRPVATIYPHRIVYQTSNRYVNEIIEAIKKPNPVSVVKKTTTTKQTRNRK